MLDMLKNDYFRLFVKREGKVVLGKNNSNLWLLTAVLIATFLAISFSNASLKYLSYKMDDPFINWVDIENDYGKADFFGLEYALEMPGNKEEFHYYDFQKDYSFTYYFFDKKGEGLHYLRCRFFQNLNTSLVEAILDDDNVLKNWKIEDISSLSENSIGVIMTEETMIRLGYDSAPSYIDCCHYSPGAEEYGFDLVNDKYARFPVPVLAVVKKLPGNFDIVSSAYFHEQKENNFTYPFGMNKDIYGCNLSYFIPEGTNLEKLKDVISEAASEYTDAEIVCDEDRFYLPEIQPFREGRFVVFDCYDDYLEYGEWKKINEVVLSELSSKGVHRVFEYDFSDYTLPTRSFISVHFEDLDKLRDFEKYVYDEFEVKIEMAQVNTKENFNAVSIMGNILSWVIIVFAIVCIILFIVNLLQSYFQKVKRNLGTFKAFGISNRDLINVYVLIMAAIILAAIVMSVSVTWMIQGFLHIFGILKDGMYDYLSLWSFKTISSIIIIVLAAIYTVYVVMRNLLKATPGDLIYDRQ